MSSSCMSALNTREWQCVDGHTFNKAFFPGRNLISNLKTKICRQHKNKYNFLFLCAYAAYECVAAQSCTADSSDSSDVIESTNQTLAKLAAFRYIDSLSALCITHKHMHKANLVPKVR